MGRRRELDTAVREAHLELQRLRESPFLMRWRPHKNQNILKVEMVPFEPGDYEWKESVYRLKAIALAVHDETFYQLVSDIEFAVDGCARRARSETMDEETRYKEWERFRAELNKSLPEAERRLLEWQGLGGWIASVWRKRKPIKQPFVGGW